MRKVLVLALVVI